MRDQNHLKLRSCEKERIWRIVSNTQARWSIVFTNNSASI